MDPYAPAFPSLIAAHNGAAVTDPARPGLDARTWLAGLAMAGVIAAFAHPEMPLPNPDFAAGDAVRYADALLAELARVQAPAPPRLS